MSRPRLAESGRRPSILQYMANVVEIDPKARLGLELGRTLSICVPGP